MYPYNSPVFIAIAGLLATGQSRLGSAALGNGCRNAVDHKRRVDRVNVERPSVVSLPLCIDGQAAEYLLWGDGRLWTYGMGINAVRPERNHQESEYRPVERLN